MSRDAHPYLCAIPGSSLPIQLNKEFFSPLSSRRRNSSDSAKQRTRRARRIISRSVFYVTFVANNSPPRSGSSHGSGSILARAISSPNGAFASPTLNPEPGRARCPHRAASSSPFVLSVHFVVEIPLPSASLSLRVSAQR